MSNVLFYLPLFLVIILYVYNLYSHPPRKNWVIGGIVGFLFVGINMVFQANNVFLFLVYPAVFLALPMTGSKMSNMSSFYFWWMLAAIPLYGLIVGYFLSLKRNRESANKALKTQMFTVIFCIGAFILLMAILLGNSFN